MELASRLNPSKGIGRWRPLCPIAAVMASSELDRPASPLRDAREQLGLLQREVADEAGCAVSLVCMAENGLRPSPAMQDRIAQAVGASAGSFW